MAFRRQGNSSGYNRNHRSIEVHTDGACRNNGRDGARAGIGGYFGHDNPMNFSERVQGRQTNNTAEIRAAERAIQTAKDHGYTQVTVKTDSQFLKNSAESWMPRWQSNGWRTADGGAVKNQEDFRSLGRAMQGVDVRFEHVPAHQGHHGNEQADRLARDGASKY